tara:strand:+ start:108 stop:338 length:231 start_codon:yes stop_codon:yes gene_type:complete
MRINKAEEFYRDNVLNYETIPKLMEAYGRYVCREQIKLCVMQQDREQDIKETPLATVLAYTQPLRESQVPDDYVMD